MTDDDIKLDALRKYPDCNYASVDNGMTAFFTLTRVVSLWRNEDCYFAGDPPRHVVESYPAE
jgi:hypothetical protein